MKDKKRPTENTQDMPTTDKTTAAKTAKVTRRNLLRELGSLVIVIGALGTGIWVHEGGKETYLENERRAEEEKKKFIGAFLEKAEFHEHVALLEAKQEAFTEQLRVLNPEEFENMKRLKEEYQELLNIQKKLEATLRKAEMEMKKIGHLPEIKHAKNSLAQVIGRNETLETLYMERLKEEHRELLNIQKELEKNKHNPTPKAPHL